MPRAYSSMGPESGVHYAAESVAGSYFHRRNLACSHCAQPLECVEQNRRSGTWLGSLICPNCRSEYFYAYRWGQLVKKG